jgi:L,D-transpeptidase YbiS
MEPSPTSPPSEEPDPSSTGTAPESVADSAGTAPTAASSAAEPAPVARRLGPLPLDRRTAWVAGVAACLLLALAWAGTGYRYEPFVNTPPGLAGNVPSDDRALKQLAGRLRSRERSLTMRLDATAPRGIFIVIDQTHNRLYLKKGNETLLEAVCSAGSGMVLKESSGKKREWVFDTPRGRFEVLSKAANPVWRKPDWAFVEEGEPIPKNPADRLDRGSLGEYALYFGNGYMIHGTLYERLLGRAVSHGCIRVGRDDLRKVWASAGIGTPIYIY